MKNTFKLLYNFLFRTKRRWLTVKTVLYAATARFRIYFFPGNKLHRYLGESGLETGDEIPGEEQGRLIYRVSDKVARVANRVPWESRCLVQAMAAQRLLRDYHIKSTLYLGVGRDKEADNRMIAHAWLRCGPYYVCGGQGEGYAVVARFVMPLPTSASRFHEKGGPTT